MSFAVATPVSTIAVAPVAAFARLPARLRLGQEAPTPLGQVEDLAFVQPSLDADHTVSSLRLGKAVIDIRAQGVQRQLPLQIPFAARDLSAIQTARNPHFDTFATETERRIHGFAHGAAKRDSLL